jgi:hypothetical protein
VKSAKFLNLRVNWKRSQSIMECIIVYGSASVSVVTAAVRAATTLNLSQENLKTRAKDVWKGCLERISGKDSPCVRGYFKL